MHIYICIYIYIYINDFIKLLLFFLFENIKIVLSLPFSPPPINIFWRSIHLSAYNSLFLLDWCVIFHSLFNKTFAY